VLRIGICEDNDAHRNEIRQVVSQILFDQIDYSINTFTNGAGILDLIGSGRFDLDLLLLDIKMPVVNGLDAARAIRMSKANTEIIFITAHDEYVYEGYVYRAFSFLKKPVSTSKLSKELFRFLHERENDDRNFITVTLGGLKQHIDLRKIDYIESFKRKVRVVMGSEELEFYSKLSELEAQVGQKLIRTHQSYLVNMQKVTSLGRGIAVLADGTQIPVSKRYWESVSTTYDRL
jgi:DNA-binding LytR/AlgR family response regulator